MTAIRTPVPGEELDLLRGQKGHTCVSIIVPTHKGQTDPKTDKLYTSHALQRAEDLLHLWHPQDAEVLISTIHELAATIDYNQTQEGLGLFVSDEVQLIVDFPFRVSRKIIVDKKFDTRDLLYKVAFSYSYFVLVLEAEKASLFYGVLQHLEEVADQNFPCLAGDDYDYQHPVRDSSYVTHAHLKSFEEDKARFQKIRYHTFLSTVNDLLSDYLTGDARLILCGPSPYTAAFLNQSRHDARVIGVINGDYGKLATGELSELVYPIIEASLEERMKDEISRLDEMAGEGRAETGYENVRQAIADGRGYKLLVEKEYPYPDTPYSQKIPHIPIEQYGNAATDAVEELVDLMLDKKGQVLLVEKNMLKDYGHIALITRY
ncbi:MAG TPA: hypothetical protein VGE66_04090 [Chitinophagaceae bacterium]